MMMMIMMMDEETMEVGRSMRDGYQNARSPIAVGLRHRGCFILQSCAE